MNGTTYEVPHCGAHSHPVFKMPLAYIPPLISEIMLHKHIAQLTPWLMEPGGSMPHSQGFSNNPYPEPNQPNSPH